MLPLEVVEEKYKVAYNETTQDKYLRVVLKDPTHTHTQLAGVFSYPGWLHFCWGWYWAESCCEFCDMTKLHVSGFFTCPVAESHYISILQILAPSPISFYWMPKNERQVQVCVPCSSVTSVSSCLFNIDQMDVLGWPVDLCSLFGNVEVRSTTYITRLQTESIALFTVCDHSDQFIFLTHVVCLSWVRRSFRLNEMMGLLQACNSYRYRFFSFELHLLIDVGM